MDVSRQLAVTALCLQSVIDSLPQGLIVADAQGAIVSANKPLGELMGGRISFQTPVSDYPRLFGAARPAGEPYHHDELPWVRAARTGHAVGPEEMVIGRPGGKKLVVACSASPILDQDGKTIGAVATIEDIAERKEFERHKDEFLEKVSHELRTPLASLKGSTQLLRRRAQSKSRLSQRTEEGDMLEIIDRQVTRLSRRLSDLMEFSSMQMGRLVLNRSLFVLSAGYRLLQVPLSH